MTGQQPQRGGGGVMTTDRTIYGVAQFEDGVMLPDGCRAGQWMVTAATPGDYGQDRIAACPFPTEAAAREMAHQLQRSEGERP